MRIRVFPSLEELSAGAADLIAERCRQAAGRTGRFVLALSGGSTPNRTYELLASRDLPWESVHVLWVDERFVPPDDSASNEGSARRALLDLVPIPPLQVHGMYAPGGAMSAAQRYDDVVRSLCADGPIDLCVMGMGADGHTASLFPGSPALAEEHRFAVAAHGAGSVEQRITLTPVVLAASALNLFLVSGSEKAATLKAVLRPEPGAPLLPAAQISAQSREAFWWIDEDAASNL